MGDWSKKDEAERSKLLRICKDKSGEYLPSYHGKGSWATTYSNEFVEASAELWKLHKKNGSYYPQYAMSRDFQSENISENHYKTLGIELLSPTKRFGPRGGFKTSSTVPADINTLQIMRSIKEKLNKENYLMFLMENFIVKDWKWILIKKSNKVI